MGLHPDSHPSESTTYTSPTLITTREEQPRRLSLEEPTERRGLNHNGCSKSANTDLHPDGHPSESTTYMGSILMATREEQPKQLSLGEPPERRGLAHNGCSESVYTNLYPDGHPSESISYMSPTLTAIWEEHPRWLSIGKPTE